MFNGVTQQRGRIIREGGGLFNLLWNATINTNKEEEGTDWSNGSLLPVLDQEQTNKQTTKQQPENGINNWFFIITLECKVETLKHMKLEDQK